MIHLRAAGRLDVGPMVDLLNEIIAIGGTTAMTEPLTREVLASWMYADARSYWHLAETDFGDLMGFQWVDPHHSIGNYVAQIGTFTRVGQTGTGVGTALMNAMKRQCRALGYEWINSEIRADKTIREV